MSPSASIAVLFEIRGPNRGVIGLANVGTTFVSEDLRLLIADGSADFVIGDTFSIVVTAGSYFGYDFAADEAAEAAGTPIVQVASGVLSADIDTLTFGAQEQFATVRGPAILPAGFVKLGNSPGSRLTTPICKWRQWTEASSSSRGEGSFCAEERSGARVVRTRGNFRQPQIGGSV